MSQSKLYILVRSDLTVAQQGVQMAHVAAQFAMANPDIDYTQQTFVCVTVDNEQSLILWLRKASQRTDQWQVFKEPDMRNHCTAGAVLHDGNLFDNLPLWDPVKELEAKVAELETSLFEERMGEDL